MAALYQNKNINANNLSEALLTAATVGLQLECASRPRLCLNKTPPPPSCESNTTNIKAMETVNKNSQYNDAWIKSLVATTFFQPCPDHQCCQRNEAHYYCIACSSDTQGMCEHCLPEHSKACGAYPFQTYRYMYNDVVRASDVNSLIELSGIQLYNANGHLAAHLRQRPAPARSPVNFSNACSWCSRKQDSRYKWCCLECKMRDLGLLEGATPPPAPASPFSLQKRASASAGGSGKAKRALNFSSDDGGSILPDLPTSRSYRSLNNNTTDDEDGGWGPARRHHNGGRRDNSYSVVPSTVSYTHRRKAYTPCPSPLF